MFFLLAQIQPVEPTVINQSGQEFVIDAGVLSEDGKNIFHTFERFGLTQEQIANFLANPETKNIFNRVNGNDLSFIDGLIKVTGGNPDFYFLNSNGIIFGQNARIDVPAAFYASTATSLQFGNDGFPLYAGSEWFATPFAIGEGIESANGDPSFLIFGSGLHNPILNLGMIQAEKIDLSGGSVVSLGELQSEGIRFSVGFNSIPWKVATDRDFWAIVPRSAFSSVYPGIDLEIEEDFQDRDIFVFSDPVSRSLSIFSFNPNGLDFSLFNFKVGDVGFNQKNIRVFRIGNQGQDFSIDLNLAIQPEIPDDLPDNPVVDEFDNPVVNEPDNLVVDEFDNPVVDEFDNPVVDEFDNPVVDEPDDPVVDEFDNPVVDEPDDPIVDESDSPVIDEPDDPVVVNNLMNNLPDNFQIDKVDFGFWNISKVTEDVTFSLPSEPKICYYPFIQGDHNRRCLLQLTRQNQNYPEMTEQQFLEGINND